MVVINIDTAKDSKEELRKTIKYLHSLLDEKDDDSFFPVPDFSASTAAPAAQPVEEPALSSSSVEESNPAAEALAEVFAVFDTEETPQSHAPQKRPGEGMDAESLLAAVEESTAKLSQEKPGLKKRSSKKDGEADTFIEIVEYG